MLRIEHRRIRAQDQAARRAVELSRHFLTEQGPRRRVRSAHDGASNPGAPQRPLKRCPVHVRGAQHPRCARLPRLLHHPASGPTHARQHHPRQVQVHASATQQLQRRLNPPRTRINLRRSAHRRPRRQHHLGITLSRVPTRREDERTPEHIRRLNRLPLDKVEARILRHALNVIQQRRALPRRIPERHLTRRKHLNSLTRPIQRHLKLSHRHRNGQPNSLQPLLRSHKPIPQRIPLTTSQKHRMKFAEELGLVLSCLTQQRHPL